MRVCFAKELKELTWFAIVFKNGHGLRASLMKDVEKKSNVRVEWKCTSRFRRLILVSFFMVHSEERQHNGKGL